MEKYMARMLALASAMLLPAFAFAQTSIDERINSIMEPLTSFVMKVIFFTVPIFGRDVPFVLVWLIIGAIFFTFYNKFVNFRAFGHALAVVRGKFDDPNHKGEVSHFQALTAALSGTVGVGNIAGVAVAISTGGPGATFWMILAGLFGMSSKFVECTLGVKYRRQNEDGSVSGGPMYYLSKGLAAQNKKGLGMVLAAIFAVACIGGSLGGGNMVQINQATGQLIDVTGGRFQASDVGALTYQTVGDSVTPLSAVATLEQVDRNMVKITPTGADVASITALIAASNASDDDPENDVVSEVQGGDVMLTRDVSPLAGRGWIFGLLMAAVVAVIIIGGIKSIARVTDKVVPFMVGIYILGALVVLGSHVSDIPAAFMEIFDGAFTKNAAFGGFLGVLILGFKRAAFSNEAGIGSASIAHSAAKTDEPVSEGVVALLEPFIDTVVICTMTALVIIITGMAPTEATAISDSAAIGLTSSAFESVMSWFPLVLSLAVILFALSTMISWSYYGLKAWTYLFGETRAADISYKAVFCVFVIIGSAISASQVFNFGDAMIFAMCFPNVLGLYFLAPEIRRDLTDYMKRVKSGAIKRYK